MCGRRQWLKGFIGIPDNVYQSSDRLISSMGGRSSPRDSEIDACASSIHLSYCSQKVAESAESSLPVCR